MRHSAVRLIFAVLVALMGAAFLVSCDARFHTPTEPATAPAPPDAREAVTATSANELVVRLLDVGHGEAAVITNGGSTVIIDGGGSGSRFGQLLDSLNLNGTTVQAVIASSVASHDVAGLRALFERRRGIVVELYIDNTDATTASGINTVRDSVRAREKRGELEYRDADDPCGDGSALCTLTLAGGARLHVMRPFPDDRYAASRSVPVKLVGPDSASFTMWFAGDARFDAADWYLHVARYDLVPGMRVNVLKGQEHGHCRALQPHYLSALEPSHVAFSLAAENGSGMISTQTLDLLRQHGKEWYRTDQNGGITFRSPGTPGSGYTVSVERGGVDMSGPDDAPSTAKQCQWETVPDPPAAPSGLTATVASSSAIDLEWSDNASDETGFRIERRIQGGSFGEIGTVGANVTSYQDTGLLAGTTYEYRVRAYNAGGTSAYSATASATTGSESPQPPAAPSGLSATAGSHSAIDLTWDDNASNEIGFRIERRTQGGSFAEIGTVGANVTSYQDTGLLAATTYEYRVRAHNEAGSSAYSNTASAITWSAPPPPPGGSELVVRVLDVGQGDATMITNGASTVFIDGGSSGSRLGALLDSLGVRDRTIDVVIVTHVHTDHASGLRALFERGRNLRVNYFIDNTDPTSSTGHATLRDSVNARVKRGETVYLDADDPCRDGSPLCTFALDGGARLHVMRPIPSAPNADDRSVPVKLVGPDSASFSMWMAGDARHEATDWFTDVARYDLFPGMKVTVLKGQEHGSCRALQPRYLSVLDPEWVTFSLEAENGKELVNTQTLDLLRSEGKRWYRTDQNGGITFRSPGTPGGGYTVSVHRGQPNMTGPHDAPSSSRRCD